MNFTATSAGLDGPGLLFAYGAICLVVALWAAWQRRTLLGPKGRKRDPLPELDPYKLALLGGGPQLAITAAATRLHQDGLLRGGEGEATLDIAGKLQPGADRLEREILDTVSAQPGAGTKTMREQVAASEPIRWMTSELTRAGLLVDAEARSGVARRIAAAGAALAALGIVALVAAAADSATRVALGAVVAVVAVATYTLARGLPAASSRGLEIVRRHREARSELRRTPMARDGVMATALFGCGALWLAEPAIASNLGVPREHERGWGGGYHGAAGGGCSTGGTCASHFIGGDGGGGGGCGGGGCGAGS